MSVMTQLFGTIGEGVNTADCGSVMQGFESLIVPQLVKKSNYSTAI